MDNKHKILLGDYDIISNDNTDLYFNLNLKRTYSEVRDYKHENIFDVYKHWKSERDASRDFRIYGIVDSNVMDVNDISIFVYSNTGETEIMQIQSTDLGYGCYNAYGFKRGKYLLELNNYTNDFVFLKIMSYDTIVNEQYFVQQVVFKDSDQNIISYGTKTIEINNNNDTILVDNDFYFFYNKHWIKKDLNIIKNI